METIKTCTHTRSRFGIDYPTYLNEIQARLEQQGGVCAICKETPYRGKRGPVLDHDHETGELRGVLCWTRNAAIGHLKDNPSTLRSAIEYLSRDVALLI